MAKLGTFKIDEEAEIETLLGFVEHLDDHYLLDVNLSKGEVVVSTRENQTLEESVDDG